MNIFHETMFMSIAYHNVFIPQTQPFKAGSREDPPFRSWDFPFCETINFICGFIRKAT